MIVDLVVDLARARFVTSASFAWGEDSFCQGLRLGRVARWVDCAKFGALCLEASDNALDSCGSEIGLVLVLWVG